MPRRSLVARLLRLSPAERRTVYGASAGLWAVAILLPILGPSRLLKSLPAVSRRSPASLPFARVVALVTATAVRLPWQSTCLHRSLVSAWLLARAGCSCTVVVGLRRPGEAEFDAHAWIEIDGVAAEPMPHGSWTSLLRWPTTEGTRH